MDLTFAEDRENNRFTALADSTEAGFVEYIRTHGDLIVFTHTEVAPEFEGQGVGSALAKHALNAARTEGLKVLITCPFLTEWISRHPEYDDITYRAKPSTVKD